jgi:tetratricopeptide (TPR) repeat protein
MATYVFRMQTPMPLHVCVLAAALLASVGVACAQEGIPRPQDIPVPQTTPQPPPELAPERLPGVRKPALPPLPDKQAGNPKEDAKPPVPPDRDAMLAELYTHLAQAPDADQASPIADSIESLWMNSGSPTINLLMQRSLKAINEQRNELASKLLDSVVELAPDYAEGWYRRAFYNYVRNDHDRAIGDLRRALALEPNHFKALEGLARILRENGQKKAALKAYQQILRINPYLPGAKEAAEELSVEVEGQGI